MFRSRRIAAPSDVSKSRQLISCPACESPLIQVDSSRPSGQSEALLERYCPECGFEDELIVATVVAEVLAEHAAELAASLEELADCLEAAGELWISQ
jgi:peptide subunit release factor 1 (eRF1)